MATDIEQIQHLQVNLLSRHDKYKLDSSIFSIPSDTNETKLNLLIKELLKIDKKDLNFDFFYQGELIGNSTLVDVVAKNAITAERELLIEYEIKKNIEKYNKRMKHEKLVHSIDFDGNWMFTACYDQNLYIWDKKGKSFGQFKSHQRPLKVVTKISQEENNIFLATSGIDTYIVLWKFNEIDSTCLPIAHLADHQNTVLSMVTVSSEDDRMLVSTSTDGSVKIWDVSNEAIQEFNQKYDTDIKTNKSSGVALTSLDKPIMTIGHHESAATGVCAIDNKKVASCGSDSHIRAWDIDTATEINTIVGAYPFTSIAYSSAKKTAICGTKQKYAQIYNINSNEASIITITLDGYHMNSVESVAWSDTNENQVVTASWDGIAFLWDLRYPKEPQSKLIHGKDRLFSCCWKHGVCFVGGESGNVYSYVI